MIVFLGVAFDAGPLERALCEKIFAATRACDLNDQQFAQLLDVSSQAVHNLRACRESGPGILRFGRLPATWWIVFIGLCAKGFCLRVIEDAYIDKLIAALLFNLELPRPRMVKADARDGTRKEHVS